MTPRVTFHPLAEADLDSIDDFIVRDSPERTIAFVRRLQQHCQCLSQMPERGPRRDDLAAGLRALNFERRVVIIYRIEQRTVEILCILYAAQDFPAEWPDN
ncbi:type II toxin-antitoxin system RelE/ParE family toxin [Mesorhizobium sp. L-8-3]|uniref:type II toxin-antitoxin system RelE/ParE family toxin n=1 Tax=Mesorhizobium sp. L-8-3 TaxID=2744522 RepID=UPI0019293381|nr:hypothetical protein MesoLjLb_50970 [Mesorhizobium sp. L-8-3]